MLLAIVLVAALPGCIGDPLPQGELQASPGATDGPTIHTERCGDDWCATAVYSFSGTLHEATTVNLRALNGHVTVSGDEAVRAEVTIETWARAPGAAEAREAIGRLTVRHGIGEDGLAAVVEGPGVSLGSGVSHGAHIDAALPVSIGGDIDTSNGRITLEGLRVRDLTVDTSNGRVVMDSVHGRDLHVDTSNARIEADDLRIAGSLEVDTSNGDIDMAIRPTGDLRMSVGSSNGDITLELQEEADIGYVLRATTSNSDIAESMSEARLEGDEDDATLRTSGDARDIQVTGRVDTSNGAIRFRAA